MANATGLLTSAQIVQQALDLTFTKRPILSKFGIDVSEGEAKFNQVVTTRILNIPAVNNFPAAATDTAYTDVSVTLNLFKQVHVAFTPQELNGTNRNLSDEAANTLAVAISNHIIDAVAANWTAANYPTNTVVASGWNMTNTIVPLRTALTGRGVRDDRRFLITNSAVYGSFLTDTNIVGALVNPGNNGSIGSGALPNVMGFSIDEYPAIPTAGNQVAFCGTPDSAIFVSRIPSNPAETGVQFPGQMQVITSDAGLSVLLTNWVDPSTMVVNNRILLMYGTAKGNANNGQRLTTA